MTHMLVGHHMRVDKNVLGSISELSVYIFDKSWCGKTCF